MVFNKEISGYENEEEFASYLNGKHVGRVYPNFLDLLYKISQNEKQIFILKLMVMLEV